ncbi:cysteine desulfurase family protein [Parasphingorhabdus halotolerans]|uniref:Cysteine desulfurase n=1 Tax=Parasphingorhabdus halotolerans TaxID=2725558 RepID=A0A6H2DJB6_9SPHN|nr:aminotransferase class V-fold PLP-dependent enzyme [Parasphingorhabdus halotolerans]QJB68424.1 aminotransferase class V-fold PLP-dependent enzyme [Parasphingorhabdus halotolerans]
MQDQKRIYLDYAATTPMLDAAKQACREGFEHWANPSSPHADGRAAQSMLENARSRFKAALGWDGDVIFTSGASEAIAIALQHSRPPVQLISTVEHDVVLRFGKSAKPLPVDLNGMVVPMNLNHVLKGVEGPALVAIQSVNNETGVMQDLASLAKVTKDRSAYLLADCSQSAGKMPLPDVDMIVVAAHKFGGPPGVGALLIKDLKLLDARGGQEQGYRSGTQNLPYIMGMVAALEAPSNWAGRATELRQHLDDAIKKEGGTVIADNAPRIATIASYHMPGVAANTQLIKFDMAGFSVSAGSACSSGTLKPSHVLEAMGIDGAIAKEVIRVSIGRDTTRTHVYAFIDQWKSIFAEARRA